MTAKDNNDNRRWYQEAIGYHFVCDPYIWKVEGNTRVRITIQMLALSSCHTHTPETTKAR